jgi:biotin operon repressor
MIKKDKHLRIRITKTQLESLVKTISTNDIGSLSEFVRTAINDKIAKMKQNGNKKTK